MTTFCIIYHPGPQWRPATPTTAQDLRPHALYMRDLMYQGKLMLAGPFSDGGGLAILEAANIEEARAIMDRDPGITGGVLRAQVHEWAPVFDRERGLDPFASGSRPN